MISRSNGSRWDRRKSKGRSEPHRAVPRSACARARSLRVSRTLSTRGDIARRAQSIRGRIALDGLCVPERAPWYAAFRAELLSFPAGKHDDQVDALGLIGQLLDTMIAGRPVVKQEEKLQNGYVAYESSRQFERRHLGTLMQPTVSHETRARLERMAKLSGRTPEQVLDDVVRLSEQELLTHMPPERRSGYMAGVLQCTVVTAPPAAPQRPQRVERDNAYVAFDGRDGSWL